MFANRVIKNIALYKIFSYKVPDNHGGTSFGIEPTTYCVQVSCFYALRLRRLL